VKTSANERLRAGCRARRRPLGFLPPRRRDAVRDYRADVALDAQVNLRIEFGDRRDEVESVALVFGVAEGRVDPVQERRCDGDEPTMPENSNPRFDFFEDLPKPFNR